ncbi:hypothetical protein KUTeg_020468 [Tegillarca granosa]|uniref:Uncharacterized protein n=1 Tax=Tegillarca granosa TaxID=220873 RepID=A0ABQ9ECB8_TEGGR|nr:hypothetical protein KUTeg_020468 [Tegillarca granosa]
MQCFIVVTLIVLSQRVHDVTAVDGSNTERTHLRHGEKIVKRSDGIMHELVNLLVDEKFNRRDTKKMIDRMLQQNEKILKQFDGFSKKLKHFEREIIEKTTSKVKKFVSSHIHSFQTLFESKLRKINKELGYARMEQKKTKNKINTIKKSMSDFNSTTVLLLMNTTTTMLSKQLDSQVNTINFKISKLKKSLDVKHGAVYIRWGRTQMSKS